MRDSRAFNRVRSKANVQNFHSMVELGPVQGSYSSSVLWVRSIWLKAGEPGEHAPCNKSPKNESNQEHKRARERTLFRRLNILSLPAPAVATPTMANGLFPGVTNTQVSSLCHLGFIGYPSNIWPSLCLFLVIHNWVKL